MQVNSKLISMLPDAPEGWKIAGEDQSYQRDNLYDYIDGGAELYLSYGFRKVCTRTYSKSDQPDIVKEDGQLTVTNNSFIYKLEPLTIHHFVVF